MFATGSRPRPFTAARAEGAAGPQGGSHWPISALRADTAEAHLLLACATSRMCNKKRRYVDRAPLAPEPHAGSSCRLSSPRVAWFGSTPTSHLPPRPQV